MPNPNQPWLDDQSLNDPRQIDADQNNRLRHHYMSLDDIGEQLFFLTGGALDAYMHVESQDQNGEFVSEKKNIYTPEEKKAFRRCAIDFFNPYKPDGSPDFDEFERRIDEFTSSLAECRERQMAFLNDESKFTGILNLDTSNPNPSAWQKEQLAQLMSPDSMIIHAIESLYDDIADYIEPELMGEYLIRKTDKGIIGDYENSHATMLGCFNRAIETVIKKEAGITEANEATFRNLSKSEAEVERSFTSKLSKEERARINARADQEKVRMGTMAKDNKVWLEPEIDISLKGLESLDNLSGQLKDADHWYHMDSKDFKQFKAALKEAHEKYEQYKGLGRELTDAEKKDLVPLFDKVADTADKYLTGKENRERNTDLGKERYDIAFSALHTTSYGRAREKLRIHNFHKEKRGAKELSVKELEERAGRTSEQQKAHHKAQKEAQKAAAKQKDSAVKSDPPVKSK